MAILRLRAKPNLSLALVPWVLATIRLISMELIAYHAAVPREIANSNRRRIEMSGIDVESSSCKNDSRWFCAFPIQNTEQGGTLKTRSYMAIKK